MKMGHRSLVVITRAASDNKSTAHNLLERCEHIMSWGGRSKRMADLGRGAELTPYREVGGGGLLGRAYCSMGPAASGSPPFRNRKVGGRGSFCMGNGGGKKEVRGGHRGPMGCDLGGYSRKESDFELRKSPS